MNKEVSTIGLRLHFVITFKIHQADVKTIFRQTPDVCQDPKLEVSHSCHDVIQMSRRKPTRTIRKWPEEAQDTMRENTETKQGATVDEESTSSRKARQSTWYPAAEGPEAMMSHVDN